MRQSNPNKQTDKNNHIYKLEIVPPHDAPPATNTQLRGEKTTQTNKSAYHQSKINIDISKFCRLCEENEETFIHLVSHCPRLTETRKEIFLDKTFGCDHTWSIRRLMEFIRLPVITRMLTSKQGALLKDIIEVDHNYTLTSDSE